MPEFVRKDTCDMCGENNVELYFYSGIECPKLHEFDEGVVCKRCGDYYINESEREDRIERDRRIDKLDDAIAECMFNEDFDDL